MGRPEIPHSYKILTPLTLNPKPLYLNLYPTPSSAQYTGAEMGAKAGVRNGGGHYHIF
jgi:hypothetical protein